MRLAGKIALITGAAAGVEGEVMGFGGAAARLFAREGAKVILTDIKEDMGHRTAAQIQENGGDAILMRLDVTREEDWQESVQTAVSRYGGLHILFNNAGMVPVPRSRKRQWSSGTARWACTLRGCFSVPSMLSRKCVRLVGLDYQCLIDLRACGEPIFHCLSCGKRRDPVVYQVGGDTVCQ